MSHLRAMDPAAFRSLHSMLMSAKPSSSDQLFQASTGHLSTSIDSLGNSASFASFGDLTNPTTTTNALRSRTGSSASIQDYLRNQLFLPSNDAMFPQQFQHLSPVDKRDTGADSNNMSLSVRSWLQNCQNSTLSPFMDNNDISRSIFSQQQLNQMTNDRNSNLVGRSSSSHMLNASMSSNQLAQLLYQAAQQDQQQSSQQQQQHQNHHQHSLGYGRQQQLQASTGSSSLPPASMEQIHNHHLPSHHQKRETDSDAYAEHGMIAPWSSRAAGLLDGMLVSSSNGLSDQPGDTNSKNNSNLKKTKLSGSKRLKQKNKDKPKRPLSAYNLFFRDERARILAQIPNPKDSTALQDGDTDGNVISEQIPVAAAKARPAQKGVKSRGPPHGKIGFEGLAKLISERWHNLPPSDVARYKEISDLDRKRYKKEIAEYREKKVVGDSMNDSRVLHQDTHSMATSYNDEVRESEDGDDEDDDDM